MGKKEFLGVMVDEDLVRKFKLRCLEKGEDVYSKVAERIIYNLLHFKKIKVWVKEEEKRQESETRRKKERKKKST